MTERQDRLVVAIDGPSGSGKSTVAKGLALACGAKYLNTGSMYRTVTLRALRAGVDLNDVKAVTAVAAGAKIEMGVDPRSEVTRLDGEDVSLELRGDEVTRAVSPVAAAPGVRALLVAEQRRIIAQAHRVVVEGRDIGAVVAPDADLKVFLTASTGARAERRSAQNESLQIASNRAQVLEQLERRDAFDANREASPFQQADDARVLDTSALTAQEAVAQLLAVLQAKGLV